MPDIQYRNITLRTYKLSDAEALAELYRWSAITLGREAYTYEQVLVWARHPENLETFRHTLSQGMTLLSLVEDIPAAFGQLNPQDHIAYLYTSPAHARQGHASAIYCALEHEARKRCVKRIHTEASRLSRPFFEHHHFSVIETEYPIRHEIVFERFKMEKILIEQGA